MFTAYIYIKKLECNTDNKMGFTCHILLNNIRFFIYFQIIILNIGATKTEIFNHIKIIKIVTATTINFSLTIKKI